MEITQKRKIQFKSGKEIVLNDEEFEEMQDYFTKIHFITINNYPNYPLITTYPGTSEWFEVQRPITPLYQPYC